MPVYYVNLGLGFLKLMTDGDAGKPSGIASGVTFRFCDFILLLNGYLTKDRRLIGYA